MNTMLRSSNAPQQTALAPSNLTTSGHPASSGVPRGVWIGGGLMALTIVALATALFLKSGGTGTDTAAQVATPAATAVAPAPATTVAQAPAATPAPVAEPAPAPVHRTVHHAAPVRTANEGTGTVSANNGATGTSANGNAAPATTEPTHVASVPVCTTCGVVDSYDAVKVTGQSNGVGAVAGGVGGAVVGSQIAGRHNKTLGGVIGAIGGGLLGNAIEQHERTTTMYDVHVRMNDGSVRTIRQATIPQVGSRVTVEGNAIHAAPQQTSSNYGGSSYNAPAGNGAATFSPSGS